MWYRTKQRILIWGILDGWKTPKKCSISLIIREVQIKTTLRFYLTLVRMAWVKTSGDSKCWRRCRERATLPLLVGLQTGATTLEISLAVPQKIGYSSTWGPSYTTPEHIPRRCSNYVHSSLIYNSQKLERTKMSLNRGMDTENMVHFIMEYYSAIKNNELMKFLGKWMELENILSEVTKS